MKAQIRIAVAAVALVTCVAFQPSQAAPPAPSVVVSLSGLNLDNEADVKVLYQRLQKASFAVCTRTVGPTMSIEVGKCASALLDVAVSEVNRPALSALHGRPLPEMSARR